MTKEELKELVGLASLELKINKASGTPTRWEAERLNVRAICYGFVMLAVGLYKKSKAGERLFKPTWVPITDTIFSNYP